MDVKTAGRKGGKIGGKVRAARQTPAERRQQGIYARLCREAKAGRAINARAFESIPPHLQQRLLAKFGRLSFYSTAA